MRIKGLLMMACMLFASGLYADDCYKNLRGETICNNGQSGAAYNPNTGKAAVSQTNENGVKAVQTNTGGEAKYNPNTGRGAVSQTNQNGVKTTHTSSGGEATTKNGKGVAQGPKGTTCAKGKYNEGCN